ncbi:uncharacterized protein LOC142349364 isoform X2 [Convolutriloba macropyga]|uniref:uncharacterized protein LOC142349364 isoform X2 n=1 Tax=Convolutriloba macropyga TaxID=536237 RepID=UPI003F5271DF
MAIILITISKRDVFVRGYFKESWMFQMPENGTDRGQTCANSSDHFCFILYWKMADGPGLEPHETDSETAREEFQQQTKSVYKQLNWFSPYIEESTTGCCSFQADQYIRNGWVKGLSPSSYLERATNMTSQGKTLMTINSRYDPELCSHIITVLAFGTGRGPPYHHQKLINGNFILKYGTEVKKFKYKRIEKELTFDWFKHNILCKDQQWMCAEE